MPAVPDDYRISPLVAVDIEALSALVHEIWHQHYPGIITVKQIEYMLEQRYSPDTIRTEIESGAARWVKLLVNGELGGFATYEADGVRRAVKLDKLYVHGLFRGRGCGAALVRHVVQAARTQGCDQVHLQVNMNNSTRFLKCGSGSMSGPFHDVSCGSSRPFPLHAARVRVQGARPPGIVARRLLGNHPTALLASCPTAGKHTVAHV